jgi:hypothetical protein
MFVILMIFVYHFLLVIMNLFFHQGFVHELRDEAGIGRLWGLISRYSLFYILTPNNQYILLDKFSNLFRILQIQLSRIMILCII